MENALTYSYITCLIDEWYIYTVDLWSQNGVLNDFALSYSANSHIIHRRPRSSFYRILWGIYMHWKVSEIHGVQQLSLQPFHVGLSTAKSKRKLITDVFPWRTETSLLGTTGAPLSGPIMYFLFSTQTPIVYGSHKHYQLHLITTLIQYLFSFNWRKFCCLSDLIYIIYVTEVSL